MLISVYMKSKFLLVAAFVLALGFSACDQIKDATALKVETDFKVDVPLETVSTSLKSTLVNMPFSGKNTFALADNADVADFINGIRNIAVTEGTSELTGLTGDNEIQTLTLKISVKGSVVYTFSTSSPLNNSNQSVILSDLSGFQTALTNNKNETFSVEVSGTSNFNLSPQTHKLKSKFSSEVKYSPL
jgi:hypothetical protein